MKLEVFIFVTALAAVACITVAEETDNMANELDDIERSDEVEPQAELYIRDCLHGDNVVYTKKGSRYVRQLVTSDEVLAVDNEGVIKYEPMYFDAHRNSKHVVKFVKIVTDKRNVIMVTGKHMIYKGETVDGSELVQALFVTAGDPLPAYDPRTRSLNVEYATNVTRVVDTGIFNPLVRSGRMLVGNLLISNYPVKKPFTIQQLHYVMWPVRQLYNVIPDIMSNVVEENNDDINAFAEILLSLIKSF